MPDWTHHMMGCGIHRMFLFGQGTQALRTFWEEAAGVKNQI